MEVNIEELLFEKRTKFSLTNQQISFLARWYFVCKDMFGFRDLLELKDQLNEAIQLLRFIQTEWQNKIINNQTSLQFLDYFYCNAVNEGLILPCDFVEQMNKLSKEIK